MTRNELLTAIGDKIISNLYEKDLDGMVIIGPNEKFKYVVKYNGKTFGLSLKTIKKARI